MGQSAGDTSMSPWCAASLLHAKSGCSPGRWQVLGTETGQQSALLVPFPWVQRPGWLLGSWGRKWAGEVVGMLWSEGSELGS